MMREMTEVISNQISEIFLAPRQRQQFVAPAFKYLPRNLINLLNAPEPLHVGHCMGSLHI